LNKALEVHEDLQGMLTVKLLVDLDIVPEDIRTAVRNNGGGYFNHVMFWLSISPKGEIEPKGSLGEATGETFGPVERFMETFPKAAMTFFDRGWAGYGLAKRGICS